MIERTLSASGSTWAIATPHALASEAGAVAFERGGNALDAALAAAVTLAVAYPHACGVGGDLFALVQRLDGEMLAVNSSGRSAAAADAALLHAQHPEGVPARGPWPITVPGAVAGWGALHRMGAELPWRDAFSQAVGLAFGGVAASRSVAATLEDSADELAGDPGLAAIFYPSGLPLPLFAPFHQPALGDTLQAIAERGPDALYRGDVGRRYVDGLRAIGSPLTPQDLELHEASVLPPLRGRFRDLHLSVAPPNSQGYALLQHLAAIERLGFDPDPTGPAAALHAITAHVVGRDRDRHLADPERMTVHPSTLLEDGHLAALCDEIRAGVPGPDAARAGGDTIALVAADAQGWAVSLIQSLSESFGAGILEPSTGIVAHDRGDCFSTEPGHPNDFAPAVRPAHTLTPVLIHDDLGLTGVAGTRGGYAQPQINAHTILRAFELGATAAEAVAAPRWLAGGMDPPTATPGIVAEADVLDDAVAAIAAAGFDIVRVGAHDEDAGHAHLIRVGPAGFDAGSDPRADGSALAG